jgi:hypothetical protein
MNDNPIRHKETEALMLAFMEQIIKHYRSGPDGPVLVLEILNALAYTTATVLGGTEDSKGKAFSPKAEAFFATALRDAKKNLSRSQS